MSVQYADLILHPIRLRIIVAVVGRERTAQQLALALADVPQATLYRQLGRLVQGGLLKIVAERPVRGTIEKVYALAGGAQLSAEQFSQASRADHMRYFTSFVASLLGEFQGYLNQAQIDPLADGVGYSELPLYLSDDELRDLQAQLQAPLAAALAHKPGPGRRRRTLALVMIPSAEPSTDKE